MAAQALTVRNAAAASLNETIRDVERYMRNPTLSKRLLESKLDRLLKSKNDLFNNHCYYAEKANLDLTAEPQTSYINPLMDASSDLCDRVELMIDDIETAATETQKDAEDQSIELAKANEINIAELQSKSDETTLNNIITAMKTIVDDENKNTKEDSVHVRSYILQIEESLQNQIKSWNTLKSLGLSTEKLGELFQKQQEIRKSVSDNIVLATAFINKVDPESNVLQTNTHTSSSASSVQGDASIPEYDKFFKMEKSKKPTFSGDIRGYARFKANFANFVAPTCKDEQHQVYVLKTDCLKGDARKLVENITELNAIWERLQDRYGDDVDIVNVIIKGVQQFTFGRSDHEKMLIKYVDEIERGIEDLTVINSRHQLANAITVNTIEEKLPTPVVTRWLQRECR